MAAVASIAPTSSSSGFLSSLQTYTPRQWAILLFSVTFLALSGTAMGALYSKNVNLEAARNALNGMTAMGTLAIGFGLGRHITDTNWLKSMQKDDFVLFLGGLVVIMGSMSATTAINQATPKLDVAKQSLKWTSIFAAMIVVIALALKKFDSYAASSAAGAKAFYGDDEDDMMYEY